MIRLILFILIILTEPSFSDVVVRRDGLPNVKGEILSGGATGLLVREESGKGTSILLPWSSIRSIEPNRTTNFGERSAACFEEMSSYQSLFSLLNLEL